MKNTFQASHFLSEISDDMAIIPKGKLVYLIEREKLKLHSFVLKKFNEKSAANPKFTRAHLARRIGVDPGLVTRWLSSPNNWRHDTVACLIIAICAGGLEYLTSEFKDISYRNRNQEDTLNISINERLKYDFSLSSSSNALSPETYLL